ncbi:MULTISPECIES: ABC transporter substrate-binding protein [Caldilinea]|jgi:multiple sugar transport system substrate-binding protein|uniref:ABC transporter substrate-binding protein n=1 Tax=Caldilinea TaxID=233191 RepID=UPI000310E5CE|nr:MULTISPECIES: ABC transporter substrate-binding protein [Caldilinea]GIV74805.1 MAG: ABC transporter substrate-binding protein [Caldilinea sp.]
MTKENVLSRRQFLKGTALVFGSVAIASCVAPTVAPVQPEGAMESAAPQEVTTLELWHFLTGAYSQVLDDLARKWNDRNPNYTLNVRAVPIAEFKREIATALAAGTVPDIAGVDNPDHASFSALGAFADVSERFADLPGKEEYLPGPLASTMWDGRHYGIPGDTNTLGLYINVDLASAAGLNVETPPRNWQELTSWAEVLSNPERNIYGIAFSARQSEEGTFQWLPFLWQNGEDIPTLDSPKAVEALALWVDWVNRGLASREVINYTQGDALGQFAASTAAMTINGSWQIPTLRRAENPINWKVVELPYSIQPASAMGGGNWAIFATSPHIDAAWVFLQEFTRPEAVDEIYIPAGRLPPRRDLLRAGDPWKDDEAYQTFFRQLEFARPRGPHPKWPDISAAIQVALQEALTGQATPEEALKKAAETIQSLLG